MTFSPTLKKDALVAQVMLEAPELLRAEAEKLIDEYEVWPLPPLKDWTTFPLSGGR